MYEAHVVIKQPQYGVGCFNRIYPFQLRDLLLEFDEEIVFFENDDSSHIEFDCHKFKEASQAYNRAAIDGTDMPTLPGYSVKDIAIILMEMYDDADVSDGTVIIDWY